MFTLLTVALACTLVATSTGALATARTPRNIAVTPRDSRAYQSPWLASDPLRRGRVAVGYAEGTLGSTSYVARSRDGGRTWRRHALAGVGAPFALDVSYSKYRRPALAYGPGGTLYAVFDACQCANFATRHSSLFITTSRDGQHFTTPKRVDRDEPPVGDPIGGEGDTLPRIAVDERSGRVYVTWTRYAPNSAKPTGAFIAYSSNNGHSFSHPRQLNRDPSTHPGELPVPTVARDGRVYVVFNDITEFSDLTGGGAWNVLVRSSRNHGRSFGRASRIARITALGCENNACLGGDYSGTPGPFVVVSSPRGRQLFATYSARERENGTPRVFFSSSRDRGKHWRRPRIIGIPHGRHDHRQIRPWPSVAPNGRVDIVYYDFNANHTFANTYYVFSTNNGRRFSHPIVLSSAASDLTIAPMGGKFIGFGNAYFQVGAQVASTSTGIYSAWTDSRRGTPGSTKQDIFFARRRAGKR